ncbi:hypothetical protein M9H77_28603 [Catharanthus roseus]|uniref:Uncharacterized protein n=1 Tax=Catharanthus roseus TaxID=4058 RepID=A0ACC0AHR8_CATRO|nr:hypothetical protein M9H77_28603 [Catharanthus roseus]
MSSAKISSYFNFISLLLFLILLLNPIATSTFAAADSTVKTSSSTGASIRKPLLSSNNRAKVDCNQIGVRSECTVNSRCKWCRSDSIDDFCFSKSEAWRLPSQVFTCD